MAPQFLAHLLVQVFRERFRQAIGQHLQHDGAMIVVVALHALHVFLYAVSGGHCESADVIDVPALLRRNEVAEGELGHTFGLFDLLP